MKMMIKPWICWVIFMTIDCCLILWFWCNCPSFPCLPQTFSPWDDPSRSGGGFQASSPYRWYVVRASGRRHTALRRCKIWCASRCRRNLVIFAQWENNEWSHRVHIAQLDPKEQDDFTKKNGNILRNNDSWDTIITLCFRIYNMKYHQPVSWIQGKIPLRNI